MKNIIKILFVFIASGALLVSCYDDVETNFDELTKDPDPNATYYLQFVDAAQSLETGVSESGGLVDIETTIAVSLMGMPASEDIKVDLTVDPSSTMESNMYTMSSQSITIPAGKTSGSINLVTIAEEMPVGEELNLIINMDAGEHNSPNSNGTKIDYNLLRINFCPLADLTGDLAGTWNGDDAFYSSLITAEVASATELTMFGMSKEFIEGWWGEPIIEGGTCKMVVKGNGIVDIPRQYIYTTTYGGAPYRYEIEGAGKWDNCGDKPKLLITYDIYYEGDDTGLAATYSPAYLPTPYMEADVVLK